MTSGPSSRLAIITGASRGIGLATALAFAERKLALTLVGRVSRELERARARSEAAGSPHVELVPADLADLDAVQRVASELALSTPSVVVHNAGVVHREVVEDISRESFLEQLDVNLTAPFLLTQALLPSMRRAATGRILFVGSISSTLGSARQSAYCASKWAIVGFMKSLAEELTDSGLMTAAVLPGSVDTRMLEGSGFPKRMSAEDVAKTLVFLALDAPLAHNGACVEMFGI